MFQRRLGRGVARGMMSAAREAERRKRARRSSKQRPAPIAEPAAPAPQTTQAPVEYTPAANGEADPGEVVWAWVPYEDDPSQGKDRPVLIVARQGAELLGLQLSSKDHDQDAAQEAREGRYWMDVGSGAWDSEARPSEVRLNRLLRLQSDAVRREGAALDEGRFREVVSAARAHLDLP